MSEAVDAKGKWDGVLDLEVKVLFHKSADMYAARLRQFGLTAYGRTPYDAAGKLGRMFVADIRAHERLGTVEEWWRRATQESNIPKPLDKESLSV